MWFESEPLKATLATDAVIGAHVSPYTPGTGYVLLHHVMGEWSYVEGGMGSIPALIAKTAKEEGVSIFTSAKVESICFAESKVQGVVLDNGDQIEADVVVSNATPHTTFESL